MSRADAQVIAPIVNQVHTGGARCLEIEGMGHGFTGSEILWSAGPRRRCQALLKNWTSRSCLVAAARVEKVPKFRRRPVLAFFFRE
jgi:hypothetical protein